ncbi:MAG: NUDIX hydrolase [Acidimicrobiales bacterium]
MRTHHFRPELRDRLGRHLSAHDRVAINNTELSRAAVAVVVMEGDQGAGFVLTRRSRGMRAHSYQYALPGGRLDPGETAEGAAERELAEEVGLAAGPNEIVGLLDDYETRSGYVITPVVFWIDNGAALRPEPAEVDEAYVVELAELDRPDSPRWVDIDESDRPVLQLPIHNRLIHAPTGAILYQFREVAMHGRCVRLGGVEEPVWAWR